MEYLPSLNAVGISRSSTATFGWEGFEHPFAGFVEARAFMWELLRRMRYFVVNNMEFRGHHTQLLPVIA